MLMRQAQRSGIQISYHRLRSLSSIYIALPVMIFLGGYLKWYFALPGISAVGYTLYRILSKKYRMMHTGRTLYLSGWALAGLFIAMLAWTQLGGMNGFLYQSTDYAARNAIFRDLITHKWPVTYQGGTSALVYYIGHWLPAALIGKAADAVFGSAETAWLCGRLFLWIWSSIGLTLLALMVFLFIDATDRKKRIIVLLVMILFSGMDIIGTILAKKQDLNFSIEKLHLEWWAPNKYQFSSITTCLYWVFNQAIIPWMVTMLVLMDTDCSRYLFYMASCLICAPMPAVGMGILMAGKVAQLLFEHQKQKQISAWLKGTFSLSNILVFLTCIPPLAAYLLCNSMSRDIAAGPAAGITGSPIVLLVKFLLFFALEIGAMLLLLWPANRKRFMFYVACGSLVLIPFIRVGFGTDFCMRGSIPALFLVMVYAAEFLIHTDWYKKEEVLPARYAPNRRTLALILVGILVIGAATPVMEIYRGLYHVVTEKKLSIPCDTTYSFENEPDNETFTAGYYRDTWFFRTLAR